MAGRSAPEIATGAVVLALAAGFLAYAVAHTGGPGGDGYKLYAKFDHIDGLGVGSDVRIGGVKVGSVTQTGLDRRSYQAEVTMSVQDGITVPADSSAVVSSDGLLGGKYLAIQPGGDEKTLPHGGTITVTQGSISLESLLGKFIFSMTGSKTGSSAGGAPASASPAPASAAPDAPAANAGGGAPRP